MAERDGRCASASDPLGLRTVGDPIDVVTGASLDRSLDARIAGPPAIAWERHYDSRRANEDRGLGAGHRHAFDREIRLDLDGARYTDADGATIVLDALPIPGAPVHAGGFTFRCDDASQWSVARASEPLAVFAFRSLDAPAQLVRLRDAHGDIELRYDDARLVEIVTPRDRVEVAWAGGHIVGLFVRQSTVRRAIVRYAYDARGRLVEGVDRYGHTFRFEYDDADRVVRKIDRRGYSFWFEYDASGRCIRSRGDDGLLDVSLRYEPGATLVTTAARGVSTYLHDANGAVRQIVDPYGGKRVFTIGANGRVVEETDAVGSITRVAYDASGSPVERLDELGRARCVGAASRAPRSVRAQCPLEWECGALVTGEILRPDANAPTLSRVPAAFRAIATLAEPWRSPNGSSPVGRETVAVHDEAGLLVADARCDGRQRTWWYDANGGVRRYRDFDGSTREHAYASWNQRVATRDATGGTTTFEYDAADALTALTDPCGTRTEFRRDLKGRVSEIWRAGALRDQYVYDAADRLVEKRDAASRLLFRNAYGEASLRIARELAGGEVHRFAHDRQGRLARAETPAGVLEIERDADGNRTRETFDGRGVEHTIENGRRTATRFFGRFEARFERDADGAIVVVDPRGGQHVVSHLGHGIVVRTWANGAAEFAQYDNAGNVLAKSTRVDSHGAAWSRRFIRSGEGDLLRVEDDASGASAFEYDAAHRLVRAVHADGRDERYGYDAAGNLFQAPTLAGVALEVGNRIAAANGRRFEFDDRQHVAAAIDSAHATRFHRDGLDQLRAIEIDGTIVWRAEYDALGRRVRTVSQSGTRHFVWDDLRLAAEIDGVGRVRLYVYPDEHALVPLLFVEFDGLDAEPSDARVHSVHCDALGAPVLVLDADGAVSWRASIDPYGAARVHEGANFHQPIRWPGHYADADTGLHYNRFRYYSPELGRYLESDPRGVRGGANVYAYADGNPLRFVDVQGLACHATARGEEPDEHSDEREEAEAARAPAEPPHETRVLPHEGGDPNAPARAENEPISERDHLTSAQRRYFRHRIDAAPRGSAEAEQARYDRHIVSRHNREQAPERPEPWQEQAERARANGERGGQREASVLNALGLDANRSREFTVNGVTTRPDAIGDGVHYEVKSTPDAPSADGSPHVVYNTEQIRAQQTAASQQGCEHVVVLTNGNRDNIRPSENLAANSQVVHYDQNTGAWSVWHVDETSGRGSWRP